MARRRTRAKPRVERQKDLFQLPLDRIIDLGRPLVRLAGEIHRSLVNSAPARSAARGPGEAALLRHRALDHRVKCTIGHVKAEHRMGRNYLTGRAGDRNDTVVVAAGYKFSLILRRLEALLRS